MLTSSLLRSSLELCTAILDRHVIRYYRPPRVTRHGNVSKPGLVKIQFQNVEDKVRVLREKRALMNSSEFSNVFLRSSKSHSDRLAEQNLKTLLDLIPDGKAYQVTGNGRLVKRDQRNPSTENT